MTSSNCIARIYKLENKKFIYCGSVTTYIEEGTLLATCINEGTSDITKTMIVERFQKDFFSYDVKLRILFNGYTNSTSFFNKHIYILV